MNGYEGEFETMEWKKKCFEILTGRDEQPRNSPSVLLLSYIARHKLSMSGLLVSFVN